MTMTAEERAGTELKDGRVVAIAGPVVDVEFPPDALPEINHAIEMGIELEGEAIRIVAEVAQQIGDNRVRAICMKPTDGLRRGTKVRNLGHGLQMPVGEGVLGHVLNVLGRLNAVPAPENAATTLQVATPPLANTARYDSLRVTDGAEEIDHA